MKTLGKRCAEVRRMFGFKTVEAFMRALVRKGIMQKTKDGRYMPTPLYAGYDLVRYQRKGRWCMYWTDKGIAFLQDLRNQQGRLHLAKAS